MRGCFLVYTVEWVNTTLGKEIIQDYLGTRKKRLKFMHYKLEFEITREVSQHQKNEVLQQHNCDKKLNWW